MSQNLFKLHPYIKVRQASKFSISVNSILNIVFFVLFFVGTNEKKNSCGLEKEFVTYWLKVNIKNRQKLSAKTNKTFV
jgi:hypothetical protein